MKITCPTCGSDTNLPDDKIPKNKDFSFKCPKCSALVPVKAAAGPPGSDVSKSNSSAMDRDTSRFPGGGVKQALVCLAPGLGRNRIITGLENAGFTAHTPETPAQALKNLEYYVYPLIVMDEAFDTEKAMSAHMNNMDMFLRRKICLIRIGPGLETGNAMTALTLSANYVVKSQDLELEDASVADSVLSVALSEHEQMYGVFKDSMKAVGKA
ncbi:zinc-ribbon domain-containing protein [uncultured Desulfobacter sp.]|uniref:zinc-ribbon domain-containing protein n=1 Tax=uncultured Desulfobacter sp. TaxID=240139 RepID=UPI002AABCAC0|nr:zinc-ribbon domain-containing protein [uncultured Desulfobacter sp.]